MHCAGGYRAAVVAGLILAGCADRPGPVGGAGAAADPAAMRPELEQLARDQLVGGRRHLYEAEMKEDRRTRGEPGHEARPGR